MAAIAVFALILAFTVGPFAPNGTLVIWPGYPCVLKVVSEGTGQGVMPVKTIVGYKSPSISLSLRPGTYDVTCRDTDFPGYGGTSPFTVKSGNVQIAALPVTSLGA